jgi:hypothetical protein
MCVALLNFDIFVFLASQCLLMQYLMLFFHFLGAQELSQLSTLPTQVRSDTLPDEI